MNDYILKIDHKLAEIKRVNKNMSRFLNAITFLNPIIIGGFIRDVINNSEIRDIDIVLNTPDNSELERIIKDNNIEYHLNSFFGYKLFIDNYTIDIWNIKNHNLFKEGIYDPTINNLNKTTFINYDSLVYDLNNKQLNINYYLDSINRNIIDFVGNKEAVENNKHAFLSIGKIFLISYKYGMNISDTVKEYIIKYYYDYPDFIQKLKLEYERHYDTKMDEKLEKFIGVKMKQYIKRTN